MEEDKTLAGYVRDEDYIELLMAWEESKELWFRRAEYGMRQVREVMGEWKGWSQD